MNNTTFDAANGIDSLINNTNRLAALLEQKRERVLTAAKYSGLTQSEIARRLHMSQAHVSQVLTGLKVLSYEEMFNWIDKLCLDCDI